MPNINLGGLGLLTPEQTSEPHVVPETFAGPGRTLEEQTGQLRMDAPLDDLLEGWSEVEIMAEEQAIPPSRCIGSAPEPARRQPSRRATTEAARQE